MAKNSGIKTTIKSDCVESNRSGDVSIQSRIIISLGPATRIFQIVHGDRFSIGRDAGSDIRIDDPSVSRTHAVIEKRRGVAFISDAGSMNGVLAAGKRIEKKTRIYPGQEILIGNATLMLFETSRPPGRGESGYSQAGCVHETKPTALEDIIVADDVMKGIFRMARKVASSNVPALIMGETGAGKDILATYIHENSARYPSRMVRISCPAIPETLVESELFGHEKGAFTGANAARSGLIEEADGSTLLLDEITEISQAIQTKLLRFLDDGKFLRLGGNSEISVDARIIATTNRNPHEAIEAGHFRKDLFFRLSTVQLYVPPLRDRKDEIVPMAEAFARRAAEDHAKPPPSMSEDFNERLLAYGWPGNVRELQAVIESSVVMSEGADLTLPLQVRTYGDRPGGGHSSFREKKEEAERDAVIEALENCGWNQTKAARLLGISRRSIVYKIKRFNLKKTP